MTSHSKLRFLSGSVMILGVLLVGCQKPATPPTPMPTVPTQSAIAIPAPPASIPPTSSVAVPAVTPNQSPSTAQRQTSAGELSVSASGRWDEPTSGSARPNKPAPLAKLQIDLAVRGGKSKDFLSVGNLRLNKAHSDGRALRLDLSEFEMFQKLFSQLAPVNRKLGWGQPDDGTNLTVYFTYPGQPIERVTQLTGHFDAVTAAQVKTYSGIKISELQRLAETDSVLKAAGLIVATEKKKFSDDLNYILQTGPAAVLTIVNLKDGAGLNSHNFSGSEFFSTGGCRHQATFSAEDASAYALTFALYTELTTITIPFDISDIPVGPLKAVPSQEQAQSVTFFASETNPTLPEGLRLDARIGWEHPPQRGVFRVGGPDPKVPTAIIEMTGPMARDIGRIESIEVTKCISESGNLPPTLPVVLNQPLQQRPLFGVEMLTQEGRPLECRLDFAPPASPFQTCKELAGEVSVVTVQERETIIFDDLAKANEGSLQHASLDQVGVTVQYELRKDAPDDEEGYLTLTVTATDWANWGDLSLVSISGRDSLLLPKVAGNVKTYSTKVDVATFPSSKLEIRINKKVKREKVPFRFLNLPIPTEVP